MLNELIEFKAKFKGENKLNRIIRAIMWKLKYEKIVNNFTLLSLDRKKIVEFIGFISETDYIGISYRNTEFYKSILFTNHLYKISCKITKNNIVIDYTYRKDNSTNTINLLNMHSIEEKKLLIQINIIVNNNIYDICRNYILED